MKKIFESYERFLQELEELPGDEVDYIRIGIAKEIDAILQRPSNDQQINKLLRAKTPGITKRNANLLLYLYKGVDEKGNLLNDQNVNAVINELDKRLSSQKGIKVEFDPISDANHFFSNADKNLIKSLDKYINKEIALY